ncbi:KTSC domain-containing protein [Brevibacillus nitrificans]|uniref:KTSC domain-containing protein n=1 Tax=Brevibacillus nitrificans TaxID=651560 RepID=UPI00262D540F|nr:KTSC domain-containing protein [Brevibacillus nitrificans]MED1792163.1 KTSC domain-containing protein [Brevibacillus nitrificans]
MKLQSLFRQFVSSSAPSEQDQEPTYKELDSRLIKSTRYDFDSQHLYIRFQDGREMVYCRVTPYAYNAFLNAESFSDHFYSFIHKRYLKYPLM